MKETTIKAFNMSIEEMLKNENEAIQKNLFNGINEKMTTEQVYSAMIINCLSLSVKLSVQVFLNLLEESGVARIDEREAEKLLLKHLTSKLED